VVINATGVLEGPDNEDAVVNTAPAAVTTSAASSQATVEDGKATTTTALLSERPAAKATGTDVAGAPTAVGKGLRARHRPPSRYRGDDSDVSNMDGSDSASGSNSDGEFHIPTSDSEEEEADDHVSEEKEDWVANITATKATKKRARVLPHKQISAGGGGGGGGAGSSGGARPEVAVTKRKGAFNKRASACW
jgi:hypothetical protein